MKQFMIFIAVFLMLSGIAPANDTEILERPMNVPKCDRPAGKLALGKISCKAASCRQPKTPGNTFLQQLSALSGQPSYLEGIGDGIGDMLLSAIKQTNCFEVLERENIEELKQELALAGRTFDVEAADFLIGGSVTSIGMETTSANIGLGIIPVLSAIDVKKTKATVGMDLRIIDVTSAKVTFTKSYQATNSKTGIGIGSGGSWTNIGFGGAFSSLRGTPIEDVVRDIVTRMTLDLVNSRRDLISAGQQMKSSYPQNVTVTARPVAGTLSTPPASVKSGEKNSE